MRTGRCRRVPPSVAVAVAFALFHPLTFDVSVFTFDPMHIRSCLSPQAHAANRSISLSIDSIRRPLPSSHSSFFWEKEGKSPTPSSHLLNPHHPPALNSPPSPPPPQAPPPPRGPPASAAAAAASRQHAGASSPSCAPPRATAPPRAPPAPGRAWWRPAASRGGRGGPHSPAGRSCSARVPAGSDMRVGEIEWVEGASVS